MTYYQADSSIYGRYHDRNGISQFNDTPGMQDMIDVY